MSLEERIKMRCVECGDCWVWQGGCAGSRDRIAKHPQISIGGKKLYVRRVLYAERRGYVPKGKQVSMTCETRLCVNPEHMTTRTISEVAQAVADTGAYSSPVRCAKIAATKRAMCGKLDEEGLRQIRESTESARAVALRLGIDPSLAAAIRRGERWKDYAANPFAGLL